MSILEFQLPHSFSSGLRGSFSQESPRPDSFLGKKNQTLRVVLRCAWNESPFFAFEIELEMLTRVTCPIHGQTFKPYYRIYVAKWLRAKQPQHLWIHHSEQHREAWFASFFPDLCGKKESA